MSGCLVLSWNFRAWRVWYTYFTRYTWAVSLGPVGVLWHRGKTYTEAYRLWFEMGRREKAATSARAPESVAANELEDVETGASEAQTAKTGKEEIDG